MDKITREEFENDVKYFRDKICSDIIKNGFDGVEDWLRIAMSQMLEKKIKND
jgi:hypothetical protein